MKDAKNKRSSLRGEQVRISSSAAYSYRPQDAGSESSGSRNINVRSNRAVRTGASLRDGGIFAAQAARIEELIEVQKAALAIQAEALDLLQSYRLELEQLRGAVDDEPEEDSEPDSGGAG